jgi:hypothetical protein
MSGFSPILAESAHHTAFNEQVGATIARKAGRLGAFLVAVSVAHTRPLL